jgi:hypothetical protein
LKTRINTGEKGHRLLEHTMPIEHQRKVASENRGGCCRSLFTLHSREAAKNINRISTLLIAFAFPVAFAALSAAQEGKTLGTVINGSTTIEFKAADTSDIDTHKLKTWNDFANQHPKIAKDLAYQPKLINDDGYAKKHPELATFFSAHPDIRQAMVENPGNYNAIPPRPGE